MAVKTQCKTEATYFFLLELASAFVLSAVHNVLFFVLDIKLVATSFAQYFLTFLFLRIVQSASFIPTTEKSQLNVFPAAAFKVLEVLIASIANSHNRTGELFLVRSVDFMFSVFLLSFYFSRQEKGFSKSDFWLTTILSVSVSVSWFEPSQIEYTYSSFAAAVILPFIRGVSFISLKSAFDFAGKGHINEFMLEYTRLVSIVLLIPAVISFLLRNVQVTASWESIDYVLMALSFIFMICNLYSQLWLNLNISPNSFIVMENSRNLISSCSQWIIQNMSHPNLIAFGGKVVAFSTLFKVWTRS